MGTPEQGGPTPSLFETAAWGEFSALLQRMEAGSALTASRVVELEFEAAGVATELTARVNTPAIGFDTQQDRGRQIFLHLDSDDEHFTVGDDEPDERAERQHTLFEQIVTGQPSGTETWLRSLYQAVGTQNENRAANMAVREAPGPIDTVFLFEYNQGGDTSPCLYFSREEIYTDHIIPGMPQLSLCVIQLHAVKAGGAEYHFHWDIMEQSMKMTCETPAEVQERKNSRTPSPAFDENVLSDDLRVVPTQGKLAAFSAAIQWVEHYQTQSDPYNS